MTRAVLHLPLAIALLLGCTKPGPADAAPGDASGIGDSGPADTGPSDASGIGDSSPADAGASDAEGGAVACLADGDCTDPTAARCDAGACVPCTDAGQCIGIAGLGLCETGACVECTIADEASCAGNSCDPATNECTATPLGLTTTCDPCVADSECIAAHRCVPMTYMGAAHGNYCMEVVSPSCMRPFGATILVDRVSRSGAAEADYCGINESAVSCEAVRALQLGLTCAGGVSECMAMGARCETIGAFDDQCTYSCGIPNECPMAGPTACSSGYCGGP